MTNIAAPENWPERAWYADRGMNLVATYNISSEPYVHEDEWDEDDVPITEPYQRECADMYEDGHTDNTGELDYAQGVVVPRGAP